MAACLAGLYWVSYGSTLFVTQLLVGWYSYTAGAFLYVVAIGVSLLRLYWIRRIERTANP